VEDCRVLGTDRLPKSKQAGQAASLVYPRYGLGSNAQGRRPVHQPCDSGTRVMQQHWLPACPVDRRHEMQRSLFAAAEDVTIHVVENPPLRRLRHALTPFTTSARACRLRWW
jgi:hypothetical protein